MEVTDVFAFAVSIIQRVLATLIGFTVAAHEKYPEYTNIVFTIIGGYLVYSLLVKSAKAWIRFTIGLIKMVLAISFIVLAYAISVRGWETFYNFDVPRIQSFASMFYRIGKTTMGSFAKEREQSYHEYWQAAEGATNGGKTGNPIIDEGLDYLRENLGSDTIDQGIEYIKDKIDLNDVQNLLRMVNH
ncbi:hypothetical protein CORT_0D01190 [Candida orthopsilosis Co 90-125]|uniref:Uncharacterized protein n=1 Tax=Candida orthopsilosis (strain 90-125) TaxID=1136231 RepID=H8X4M5_CANO9|nr:hypothetical protein CORT_0D01190 [Candida orthopsilosis Co 90-125]CCG22967.1 hypothetical protein CORT_0D01190 [Candida orthopsilosis Co 90-125]